MKIKTKLIITLIMVIVTFILVYMSTFIWRREYLAMAFLLIFFFSLPVFGKKVKDYKEKDDKVLEGGQRDTGYYGGYS